MVGLKGDLLSQGDKIEKKKKEKEQKQKLTREGEAHARDESEGTTKTALRRGVNGSRESRDLDIIFQTRFP